MKDHLGNISALQATCSVLQSLSAAIVVRKQPQICDQMDVAVFQSDLFMKTGSGVSFSQLNLCNNPMK